jgi:hypothetical protein
MRTLYTFEEFLNESKQVGILYHYTYYEALVKILESGKLLSGLNDKGSIANPVSDISFTRNKNFHKTRAKLVSGPPHCRLVIDGDKLSNTYSLQPYAQKGFVKDSDYFESEEVIRKEKPFSIPIEKYIISVDFVKDFSDKHHDYHWIHEFQTKSVDLCKERGITMNVVDSLGNSVPQKEKESFLQKLLSKIKNK